MPERNNPAHTLPLLKSNIFIITAQVAFSSWLSGVAMSSHESFLFLFSAQIALRSRFIQNRNAHSTLSMLIPSSLLVLRIVGIQPMRFIPYKMTLSAAFFAIRSGMFLFEHGILTQNASMLHWGNEIASPIADIFSALNLSILSKPQYDVELLSQMILSSQNISFAQQIIALYPEVTDGRQILSLFQSTLTHLNQALTKNDVDTQQAEFYGTLLVEIMDRMDKSNISILNDIADSDKNNLDELLQYKNKSEIHQSIGRKIWLKLADNVTGSLNRYAEDILAANAAAQEEQQNDENADEIRIDINMPNPDTLKGKFLSTFDHVSPSKDGIAVNLLSDVSLHTPDKYADLNEADLNINMRALKLLNDSVVALLSIDPEAKNIYLQRNKQNKNNSQTYEKSLSLPHFLLDNAEFFTLKAYKEENSEEYILSDQFIRSFDTFSGFDKKNDQKLHYTHYTLLSIVAIKRSFDRGNYYDHQNAPQKNIIGLERVLEVICEHHQSQLSKAFVAYSGLITDIQELGLYNVVFSIIKHTEPSRNSINLLVGNSKSYGLIYRFLHNVPSDQLQPNLNVFYASISNTVETMIYNLRNNKYDDNDALISDFIVQFITVGAAALKDNDQLKHHIALQCLNTVLKYYNKENEELYHGIAQTVANNKNCNDAFAYCVINNNHKLDKEAQIFIAHMMKEYSIILAKREKKSMVQYAITGTIQMALSPKQAAITASLQSGQVAEVLENPEVINVMTLTSQILYHTSDKTFVESTKKKFVTSIQSEPSKLYDLSEDIAKSVNSFIRLGHNRERVNAGLYNLFKNIHTNVQYPILTMLKEKNLQDALQPKKYYLSEDGYESDNEYIPGTVVKFLDERGSQSDVREYKKRSHDINKRQQIDGRFSSEDLDEASKNVQPQGFSRK